jgi:ABC-2 type transport system permease protein
VVPISVLSASLAADLALVRISFKRRAAYKRQWILGALVASVELFTALALWRIMLGDRSELAGYDQAAMQTYAVIAFVAAALTFGGAEDLAAQRVLDGMVAIDLLKPTGFQRARAAEYLGSALGNLPTITVGLAAALVFLDPLPPASLTAGILALASATLIVPLAFGLAFLSIMLCFWTRSYHGVLWARRTLTAFLSGLMIPVALMPSSLQQVLRWLPFVHFSTTPSDIYLGRVDTIGALGLIALEAAWCTALWITGRVLWARAARVVTVHGG